MENSLEAVYMTEKEIAEAETLLSEEAREELEGGK